MQHSPSSEVNITSASQEIPEFYGSRRFITAFTTARHLYLSWSKSNQFVPPSYFLKIHFIIILPFTRRFPSDILPSGTPTKTLCAPFFALYALYARPIPISLHPSIGCPFVFSSCLVVMSVSLNYLLIFCGYGWKDCCGPEVTHSLVLWNLWSLTIGGLGPSLTKPIKRY